MKCSICEQDLHAQTVSLWTHFATKHHIALPLSPDFCVDSKGLNEYIAKLNQKQQQEESQTSSSSSSSSSLRVLNFESSPELKQFFKLPQEQEAEAASSSSSSSSAATASTQKEENNNSNDEEEEEECDFDDDDDDEDDDDFIDIPATCLYCNEVTNKPLDHLKSNKHGNFDLPRALCTFFGQKPPHEFPPSHHHRIAIVNSIRKSILKDKKCPFGSSCAFTFTSSAADVSSLEKHLLENPRHRFPEQVPDLSDENSSSELLVPVLKNDGMIMLMVSLFDELEEEEEEQAQAPEEEQEGEKKQK